MRKYQIIAMVLMLACISCGQGSSDDKSSDNVDSDKLELSDNFPDFYELAKLVTPSVDSDSEINSAAIEVSLTLSEFDATYETDDDVFVSAFGLNENYIGQVLNDAGSNGPVKSIYVLLAQVQDTLDNINNITEVKDSTEEQTDDESESSACIKVDSSSVKVPFFKNADTEAFNNFTDKGKYTCSKNNTESVLVFGSELIEDADDDCDDEDAYEYYVMEGSSEDDAENTEQVDTRGSTRDFSSIKKFYYNGCSGDLKIIYAQTTLYEAGVEFTSRTELSGNTGEHSFQLRSNFIDADDSYATHNTFLGVGKSQKSDSSDDDAHFIMGYRSDDCGTSDDSSECTLGTPVTFCVANSGTGKDFSRASDTSNCSDYESDYEGMEVLSRSDLPTEYFEVSEDELGI